MRGLEVERSHHDQVGAVECKEHRPIDHGKAKCPS
jgi:hypothetical protein